MTGEEILSIFYDNILFKRVENRWQFKENLSFYKSKILSFDLLDQNGKILITKGTKVNQKIINEIKKKNNANLLIEENSLVGFYIASDIAVLKLYIVLKYNIGEQPGLLR